MLLLLKVKGGLLTVVHNIKTVAAILMLNPNVKFRRLRNRLSKLLVTFNLVQ